MKSSIKKFNNVNVGVKSFFSQWAILTVSILTIFSCQPWELPATKQLRQCQSPLAKIEYRAQKLETTITLTQATGTIDAITWKFGDGENKTTTALSVQYTYKNPGSYPLTATLTNTCGNSVMVSQTIVVSNAVPPVVTTQDPVVIGNNSATLRMTLTDNGNAAVTRYGICYSSANSLPTINDQVIVKTGTPTIGTIDQFSATQLTSNMVYYVRGFAENTAGIGYGNVKSITTGSQAVVSIGGLPTVTDNTASVLLRIDNPGSPSSTQFGIVYSATNTNPDLTNSSYVDVNNPVIGSNLVVNLTNLKANTTYTYRPFARTTATPVYGSSSTFTTQGEAVSTRGLVVSIPFANRSLTDVSGNNLHAQTVNNLTFVSDRKGSPDGAILLNGINDYFFIPDNALLRPDSITISLWVRPITTNSPMQLFNKSRFSDSAFEQYAAQLKPSETGNGQKIVTAFKQGTDCQIAKGWQEVSLYSNFLPNTWHHFTFTLGGKTAKLYMDGQLFGSNNNLTGSGLATCTGGELRFGLQVKDYEYFFNGAMDDIRIYRRVLSDNEIKNLYNQ